MGTELCGAAHGRPGCVPCMGMGPWDACAARTGARGLAYFAPADSHRRLPVLSKAVGPFPSRARVEASLGGGGGPARTAPKTGFPSVFISLVSCFGRLPKLAHSSPPRAPELVPSCDDSRTSLQRLKSIARASAREVKSISCSSAFGPHGVAATGRNAARATVWYFAISCDKLFAWIR